MAIQLTTIANTLENVRLASNGAGRTSATGGNVFPMNCACANRQPLPPRDEEVERAKTDHVAVSFAGFGH